MKKKNVTEVQKIHLQQHIHESAFSLRATMSLRKFSMARKATQKTNYCTTLVCFLGNFFLPNGGGGGGGGGNYIFKLKKKKKF
jgi:hypothetical protein